MGKSCGVVKAAADTDQRVTVPPAEDRTSCIGSGAPNTASTTTPTEFHPPYCDTARDGPTPFARRTTDARRRRRFTSRPSTPSTARSPARIMRALGGSTPQSGTLTPTSTMSSWPRIRTPPGRKSQPDGRSSSTSSPTPPKRSSVTFHRGYGGLCRTDSRGRFVPGLLTDVAVMDGSGQESDYCDFLNSESMGPSRPPLTPDSVRNRSRRFRGVSNHTTSTE